MIKAILVLLLCTGLRAVALDPIQDYLVRNTLSSKNSKYDGQLFAGEPWTGDNHQQPGGGYLIRFNAPIGPNRTGVTFVASSLFAYLRGSNWFAYANTPGGAVLLNDHVSFEDLTFYFAPASADHGPVLCQISNGRKSFGVSGICIDKSGQLVFLHLPGSARDQDKEEADPAFEKEEGDNLIKQDQLTAFKPTIEKILLAEYLKDPSMRWRSYNGKWSVRGQGADPDEKSHIAAFKDFREEDAAQRWRAVRPGAAAK